MNKLVDKVNNLFHSDSKSANSTTSQKTASQSSRQANASQASSEATQATAQLRNKLAERGEKINQVQVKSAELADASSTFAANCKKLGEKQASKKWYQ